MFSDPGTVIEQSHIGEGMIVADFGAGVGFYSLPLARRVGPYGRVFAIDVEADHLRLIRNEANKQGWHQVEVIQGDLEAPKGSGIMTASVDRVIISNILFQADNPGAIIEEAKRILKHSGKITVVDWADSFSQIGPAKEHVISEEKAKQLFESKGLKLEGFIDAGTHHYGLLYCFDNTPVAGSVANIKHDRAADEINPAMVLPPEELKMMVDGYRDQGDQDEAVTEDQDSL